MKSSKSPTPLEHIPLSSLKLLTNQYKQLLFCKHEVNVFSFFSVGFFQASIELSAGILEQSVEARNRVGTGLSYRPVRLQRLAVFDSLESILGLLKSLKIRVLDFCALW